MTSRIAGPKKPKAPGEPGAFFFFPLVFNSRESAAGTFTASDSIVSAAGRRASDFNFLAPWTRRPVRTQRARTQPHARPQRRRHPVQRSRAIGAKLRLQLVRAKPLAARRALRINALHSPAGKILHDSPKTLPQIPLEKLSGFWGKGLVVSRENTQLVGAMLRKAKVS